MFRYQFLLFLPLLIYLILTFVKSKKGRIQTSRLIPFFSCGYGPLYSLVKFQISTINAAATMATASSISIILILLWKKFSPFVYLYLFGVIITLFVRSIINDLSLYEYAKTLQVFIILMAGLITGAWFRSCKFPDAFFSRFVILMTITAGLVILVRYFSVGHVRDAGFSLFLVPVSIYALLGRRKLLIVSGYIGFFYLLTIQSRTTYISILVSLFYMWPYIRERYGLKQLLLPLLVVITIIGSITMQRTFSDNDSFQESVDNSSLTRMNAVLVETKDFSESILFGKGAFYYYSEWKQMIFDVRESQLSNNDYVAYNHIGVISSLAQVGIIGTTLLILIPLVLIIRHKSIGNNLLERTIIVGGIIFLISFLISGSPIRTDFQDAFWYYFVVGYLLNYHSKKELNKE